MVFQLLRGSRRRPVAVVGEGALDPPGVTNLPTVDAMTTTLPAKSGGWWFCVFGFVARTRMGRIKPGGSKAPSPTTPGPSRRPKGKVSKHPGPRLVLAIAVSEVARCRQGRRRYHGHQPALARHERAAAGLSLPHERAGPQRRKILRPKTPQTRRAGRSKAARTMP